MLSASRAAGPASPGRENASAADPKLGSAENRKSEALKNAKPRNLVSGCAALRFRWLGGAFQQALRLALKLQTRVLMGLATRQR